MKYFKLKNLDERLLELSFILCWKEAEDFFFLMRGWSECAGHVLRSLDLWFCPVWRAGMNAAHRVEKKSRNGQK